MTCEEFSNMFDTLLNSYASKATFGDAASASSIQLDEYEKSVLLTQAQDEIVKSYFDARLNVQGQGMDNSERRQADFSSLIITRSFDEYDGSNDGTFDSRGIIYNLKDPEASGSGSGADAMYYPLFILNEKLVLLENTNPSGAARWQERKKFVVVPMHYKEYDRLMEKAYSQPLKKQAWRLFNNQTTGFDVFSEVIPIQSVYDEVTETGSHKKLVYKVRYVRRPNPIVLVSLPDGLSVDGISEQTECELNPIVHIDILNRAVELAMTTRGGYADAVSRFRQEQAQQAQRARQAAE